jgi:RNA-binding protein PNO1
LSRSKENTGEYVPAVRQVEIKTTAETGESGGLQKAADFVHAFILGELLFVPLVKRAAFLASIVPLAGFEVQDAIALLRLDDLYVECFEIKDVKVLLLANGI